MNYPVKTPRLFRILYPSAVWKFPTTEKLLYLSFDDGPHPEITPFVLETLKRFSARASFFCIGKNVLSYPAVFESILQAGHAVGNHTFNHLNGWKTETESYIRNIAEAGKLIPSHLFRPPYGRIRKSQLKQIRKKMPGMKVIMWDVLSGDFDRDLSANDCSHNVIRAAEAGSIVVFHDSEKAFPRMQKALPEVLKFFSEAGFRFDKIHLENKE